MARGYGVSLSWVSGPVKRDRDDYEHAWVPRECRPPLSNSDHGRFGPWSSAIVFAPRTGNIDSLQRKQVFWRAVRFALERCTEQAYRGNRIEITARGRSTASRYAYLAVRIPIPNRGMVDVRTTKGTRHEMTVLVTGATGLIGANVCALLRERGDEVRALVRPQSDSSELRELGIHIASGDITSEDDVRRAVEGCSAVINSAAILGGPGQDPDEQLAANYLGSVYCYDAAARAGARVVELTTTPFLRSDVTLTERPEVIPESAMNGNSYAISKGRAFVDGRYRAERGQDICFVIPGGTFGPSPVPRRAMHATSYNRVLRGGVRGKIAEYARFPIAWVLASDVAEIVVGTLDRGEPGLAYIAFGAGPALSTAEFLNLGCEEAGVDHRVRDIVLRPGDSNLRKQYGETIYDMAIRTGPDPFYDDSLTRKTFQNQPKSIREGVAETIAWFRQNGLLDG
jgi:dihydroflavonol-4-reductase